MDKLKQHWENEALSFHTAYESSNPLKYPLKYFLNLRFLSTYKLLEPKKSEKIIDIGCGSGYYMKYAIEKGSYVVGIDYSKKMLNIAKKHLGNNKNYKLVLSEFPNINIKPFSFDKALAIGFLDYVKNPENSLKGINKILKKNSICIITFTKKYTPFFLLRIPILRKFILNLPQTANVFSHKEMLDLINKTGFSIIKKKALLATTWLLKLRKL